MSAVTVTELVYVSVPYDRDDQRQYSFLKEFMDEHDLRPFYLGFEEVYNSHRCQISGFYSKEDAKLIADKWDEYKPMTLADFPDDHYVARIGGFLGCGMSYFRKSKEPPYQIYAPWYGIDHVNVKEFDLVGGEVVNVIPR